MIHVDWRSFLAALALVTVSGCAAETSTTDLTIADEEQDRSSSAAAASEDDLRALRSIEATPGIVPVAPQTEPPRSDTGELDGPYPEPWSSKPD